MFKYKLNIISEVFLRVNILFTYSLHPSKKKTDLRWEVDILKNTWTGLWTIRKGNQEELHNLFLWCFLP